MAVHKNFQGKGDPVPIHVEIWICSRLLSKGKEIFTKQELSQCIWDEFGDDRHGVSTHISSVCVANKKLNHPSGFNYLVSIERGFYRTYKDGDRLDPTRARCKSHPMQSDIPSRFKYLIDDNFASMDIGNDFKQISYPRNRLDSDREIKHSMKPIDGKILKDNEKEAIAKTILMMAYNPSCARIFSKQTNAEIKKAIFKIIEMLPSIKNQDEFDRVHKNMLETIVQNIQGVRGKRNPKITYGQAQKGLNVFLKVYVDWASLPTNEIANIIRPFLHCPLDSVVMNEIKRNENEIYRNKKSPPCSMRNIIAYEQYLDWQCIINEIVERESCDKRTIIDVIWYLESLKKKEPH